MAASIIVQSVWTLDLLWLLLFNTPLNNVATYIFSTELPILELITTSKHLFAIPIGLFSVFRYSSPSKKAYYFIIAFGIIFFGLSGMLSSETTNLNCMDRPCFKIQGIDGNEPFYPYYYPFVIILAMVAANFILNYLLKAYSRKKNRKAYKAAVYAIIYFLFFAALAIAAAVIARRLALGV